jgi:hypothetical protein
MAKVKPIKRPVTTVGTSPKGKRPGQIDVQPVGKRLPATTDKHAVGKIIGAKPPAKRPSPKRKSAGFQIGEVA